MASRGNTRRGPAPIYLTPHPKQVISVEEWEALSPLGDIETRSVAAVKAAAEKIPLPLKFTADAGSSSPPSTPRRQLLGSSRPGTPNNTRLAPTTHALHPKAPVQTPQQFYDWFALIDRSVAHSQEAHFRAHVASVAEHLNTCDLLIEKINEVDSEVESMLEGWRTVEEGGKSLKEACERLLEERDSLLGLTQEIDARLEYFSELEHATRMLNHPGESLVLQTDFLYMVERVDICIDYLRSHRHFRESEVYLLRFQQCLTRAMTLIKMFFVGSLRALSSDISRRLSEKDVSPTAQHHLLYTRFRSVSTQLAPLLGELERRAQAHPEELSALLSECHSAYFSARKALLVGRITEEIKGLDPGRTELVELTRSGCSFLKQLCTDEFDLYREFFHTGERELYAYLETLCDFLYDDLRPRILHEPRLTALCEVCTVLQALMVLDVTPPADDDEGSEEEQEQLHISNLLQMVLQDAQTRLFFKAQAVVQSDIRYYVSKQEDLAYPEKLLGAMPSSTGEGTGDEKASISQMKFVSDRDTWFPTVQKTVWVLEQLHEFVKPAIFEDIAQEALTLCCQSLVTASEPIRTRSPLDAELFLARHLMILKEVAGRVVEGSRNSGRLVGSGLTDTLNTYLPQSLMFAARGGGGTASGEVSIRDAKFGIDTDLRRAFEIIIESLASHVETLREGVEKLKMYMEDERTVNVLLRHVRERIEDRGEKVDGNIASILKEANWEGASGT